VRSACDDAVTQAMLEFPASSKSEACSSSCSCGCRLRSTPRSSCSHASYRIHARVEAASVPLTKVTPAAEDASICSGDDRRSAAARRERRCACPAPRCSETGGQRRARRPRGQARPRGPCPEASPRQPVPLSGGPTQYRRCATSGTAKT